MSQKRRATQTQQAPDPKIRRLIEPQRVLYARKLWAAPESAGEAGLALASFKALLRLVDDVSAPATADHAVIPVTVLERLERIADLHDRLPVLS